MSIKMPVTMPDKNKKYKLYLEYKETHTGGDIAEGEEDEDYPSRNDSYVEFTPVVLLKNRKNAKDWHIEEIKVNKEIYESKNCWMAIVRHTEGDTFGNSFGHWQIIDIKTSRKELPDNSKEAALERCKENNIYPHFDGYFSNFTDLEYYCLLIED